MEAGQDITVVRTPRLGGYVIIDSGGIPRTVPNWRAVVQVLGAIAMETSCEIEAKKVEIDAGATKRFRSR
jgi:hypothetical protein